MKKKWNKTTWGKSRYGKYYREMMAPIWAEKWEQDLKRIQKLKKNIESLGPIPKKEVQVIKTTNYFIKLIDLLTSFIDSGNLKYAPADKYEAVIRLDDAINFYVGRSESALCYLNKAQTKQSVTWNNLYIGLFEEISAENITEDIRTRTVDNVTFKVLADYSPVIDWLNRKVISVNGHTAGISQKALLSHIEMIQKTILSDINSVLE